MGLVGPNFDLKFVLI